MGNAGLKKRFIRGFGRDPAYLEARGYLSPDPVRNPVKEEQMEVGWSPVFATGLIIREMERGSIQYSFKGGDEAYR